MTEEDYKELFKYIAQNQETESALLTPYPSTTIELKGLLDKIAEIRGISKEDNGRQYNTVCDELESLKS